MDGYLLKLLSHNTFLVLYFFRVLSRVLFFIVSNSRLTIFMFVASF